MLTPHPWPVQPALRLTKAGPWDKGSKMTPPLSQLRGPSRADLSARCFLQARCSSVPLLWAQPALPPILSPPEKLGSGTEAGDCGGVRSPGFWAGLGHCPMKWPLKNPFSPLGLCFCICKMGSGGHPTPTLSLSGGISQIQPLGTIMGKE